MYEAAVAYKVPFELTRTPPTYQLRNIGPERVEGVALTIHGRGLLAANAPATLDPGERLEVVVAGRHLAASAIFVVRWLRLDGVEYLWRVSL